MVACNWYRFGKGSHQELKNAICILGNNIINQKVQYLNSLIFHSYIFPLDICPFVVLALLPCTSGGSEVCLKDSADLLLTTEVIF